jgi:chromosome segregation ATPase
MSDHDFGHPAGDPLPDRLKQYLTEMARRELETLRADLEVRLVALESALARPDQHDSIETLVFDLARAATVEAEAAASRAMLAAQIEAQERSGTTGDSLQEREADRDAIEVLRAELDELRSRADAEIARARSERDEVVAQLASVQRDLATAQRELEAARRDANEARQLAGARLADLSSARDAAGAAQVEAAARVKTLEAKVAALDAQVREAERVRREAVARADAADVLARETVARASNAEAWGRDTETRLQTAEARAAQDEARVHEAEGRARAAEHARDVLAVEIEGLRQTIARHKEESAGQHAAEAATAEEYERRLTAADERIRILELQLFQRDRPEPGVSDEELADMLTSADQSPFKPTRIASRYSFGGGINVEIDGQLGALIDLSTTGAQVLSPVPLDEGSEVTLRLMSDEIPTACRGRIAWTRLEPKSPRQPLRHRAGVLFTQVDVGAVEAFIIRYAAT